MASASTTTTLIHLNAPTHSPIRLHDNNFPVWQRQGTSTLIGLDLLGLVDGSKTAPPQFTDTAQRATNPAYTAWYRQYQILISALLGSCLETIQPLISSAATAQQAWSRLVTSYANDSKGRVIYLKTKLSKNPKSSRSVVDYLQDMRSIADALAAAQSPVDDDDLIAYVLNQLGDDYASIIPAVRVQKAGITYGDLYNILIEHERMLKDAEEAKQSHLVTANVTQRQNPTANNGPAGQSNSGFAGQSFNRDQGGNYNQRRFRGNRQNNGGFSRNNTVCRFCNLHGHEAKVCRKLARLLREVGVTSGASHHATSSTTSLPSFSEYGGPDEIHLADGNRLKITHTGTTVFPTPTRDLSLNNVLCVPKLRRNLVSVSKLCQSNGVSVEFFPNSFHVKDLRTGACLMQGNNMHDVYSATMSCEPQINTITLSSVNEWHHRLGHPSNKVLGVISRNSNYPFKSFDVSTFHFDSCSVNKSHKLPFAENTLNNTKPLELLYTDVWGTKDMS
ncbi:PREDICTED: uncharacterized protein LOC109168224 [Ipomoea nil]|uniref:uncharacterized protein LOC109168224 n=1 Tax=Ipomoea nil TaxID=35883 RepID=UPI00090160A4|nr:PREDICTED: uncharacterized protein LOC109168224 [Ipomoea nil]